MIKLTGKAVDDLMRSVLYTDKEVADANRAKPVLVEGLVRNFGFNPERLAEAKPKIDELLLQLPVPFYQNKGGGWTFLNLCNDANDAQWTGLHATMEALVCLGIGVGSARWLMKEHASAMPGGVPYVEILLDTQKVETVQ